MATVIIGGGVAGLTAAIRLKELLPREEVVVVERAHVLRSGCLAAGVNALNNVLLDDTPESYVDFLKKEFPGLIEDELPLSLAKRLNETVELLESWGANIPKDNGKFFRRGKRSIIVYGENLKEVIAQKALKTGIKIFNRTFVFDVETEQNQIVAVLAYDLTSRKFLRIAGDKYILATGGAAGLYQGANPYHPGSTWYPLSNSGVGHVLAVKAGAYLKSLEIRFIPLRVKGVAAPTGTLAMNVKGKLVNQKGEELKTKYQPANTAERLKAVIEERRAGEVPVFVVEGVYRDELIRAYFDMRPGAALLLREDKGEKIYLEVDGFEPLINGGHGLSGVMVDKNRKTAVENLWACGDIAAGSPKKYVTGAMAEGLIAAEDAAGKEGGGRLEIQEIVLNLTSNLKGLVSPLSLKYGLNVIMEEYAGGKKTNYRYTGRSLEIGEEKLYSLKEKLGLAKITSDFDLLQFFEVKNQILLATFLIKHMAFRTESRLPCYQERGDYPGKAPEDYLLISQLKEGRPVVERRKLNASALFEGAV
ncbi:adenylyl-sulfate reductase subunit alpha [Carboxydothermus hydrogenoformans]|uniref:Putative adenylylsulfate reductase, alpha subunit n=1 Tax=Carboxydothermus hydrogenoformans (strain ATCC BAA-161 / DSM 6008 / Z-2901) TaxID=246194 RepID=Q3A8Q8_CARHZ|nr:adenylyl-sulfate reductase subunit alpha [Carboxydothermus hydrogenoformans]ABB15679.1 putative adenylylsulfate reductase, alpha subunit [Carboxydothermus hydrogenoformans Z-2901]